MKPMSSSSSDNNNNWLGFSLSPHMNNNNNNSNMDGPSLPHPAPSALVSSTTSVPAGFYNLPSYFNYSPVYTGAEAENGGFSSLLSMMPLKSDGSLCMMETITRSQPQGMVTPNSTPKLEDFFGGTTMGTHQYETNDREAMALSLDSIYYNQNTNNETSSQDFINHFHNSQVQNYANYSAFRGHDPVYHPPQEEAKETRIENSNLQLPTIGEDEITSMKNWVSRNYPNDHHPFEQIGCMSQNGCEPSGSTMDGAIRYGDLQSLSLSMSPGSQTSCVSRQISPAVTDCVTMDTKKRGSEKVEQKQIVHRKSIDTFGQRTSQYRGVTSCKKEGQSRKGRQGGYDMEEKAARAYDLAALKYWGPSTHINFSMEKMTRQEYVAHLRRKSSGFSRGASIYRGVTRHHQHGRWQARIGRVAGNKDLYLGTFSTQEEAAEAYDVAAIKFRGVNAVTNFDISRYDVERIMASNTLLAGELARRNKGVESNTDISNQIMESTISKENNGNIADWKMVAMYQSSQPDQKPSGLEDHFRALPFSMAAQHLTNTMRSAQAGAGAGAEAVVHAKMGSHMPNGYSLAATSREGNSDKNNSLPVLITAPPSASKFLGNSTSPMTSWISSAQLRPHAPLFAAWADAS
ncbi:hypothetical protein LguiB_019337 [Lonicera macranthoides]